MGPANEVESAVSHQEGQLDAKRRYQTGKAERSSTERALESTTIAGTDRQTHSPTRRPLTRSQSGIAPKRPRVDSPEVQQKTPRKKMKSNPDRNNEASSTASKVDNPVALPRQISMPKRGHTSEPANESREATPDDHPPAKLRANLPVPVPNLTKKSRGRRVPTQTASDPNPIDASRMYVCKVENCGKCFHRGEHLKRHIRSIHTHEKPFDCTYPSCNKHFNRHDNLLQHLKVHRDLATSETSAADEGSSTVEMHQTSPSPPTPDQPTRKLQPYYSSHIYEPPSNHPHTVAYQPSIASFRTFDSEPVSLRTNMAVSSLRTEIPQSPPRSRA